MAQPQGFTPLTDEQMALVAREASEHDRGQSNVLTRASGFAVTEEFAGRGPFPVYALSMYEFGSRGNESIQAVGVADVAADDQIATLLSTQSDRAFLINAHNDGRVELVIIYANGETASIDITAVMAEHGITAAGIQRTALDMAADGEITRPTTANPNLRNEQQEIIDMVNNARQWAGYTPSR